MRNVIIIFGLVALILATGCIDEATVKNDVELGNNTGKDNNLTTVEWVPAEQCTWDNTTYSKAMLPAIESRGFENRWIPYYNVTNISRCGVWNEFDAITETGKKAHIKTTADFLYYEKAQAQEERT